MADNRIEGIFHYKENKQQIPSKRKNKKNNSHHHENHHAITYLDTFISENTIQNEETASATYSNNPAIKKLIIKNKVISHARNR